MNRRSWPEIDRPLSIWKIPGERMKMDQDHHVPLSAPALAILDEMPNGSQRELIFPNPDGGQFSENAMLAVLGNRAIILRFAVLENHRQSRPLVDVIEERGIKTGADIVRYAAYAHHEMAGPVIGRPQVRHLKRRGKMCFRSGLLNPSDQGCRRGHGRTDIGLHGRQILRSRARRERDTSHRRKSCADFERESEMSGRHQQAKLGH
jgi:hypothetical protein